MSKVSCESCDDLIEVFGNILQLPYICIRCEKDSALAIEQDVWEAEYVGPACQQAAEEVHGLYIEEEDDIPCDDATTYYIVEARSKFNKSYDWFRSQNANTYGIFDDYSTAKAEKEGFKIIMTIHDEIVAEVPIDSPLGIDKLLDPIKHEIDDFLTTGYRDTHDSDVLDQFNTDTEIINDLREQLDEAHVANANLTEEIEFCDKKVRAYQQAMAETDKHAAGLEGTIEILKSELRGISIRANDAVLGSVEQAPTLIDDVADSGVAPE